MIRIDHVSKQFSGHTAALSDVTVEINDGEFVFLIGSSGAGKTTLLRLLIHDITPTHGSIFVDSYNVTKIEKSNIPLLRRKIGMVFQDFKLLFDRTVFENVAIGLDILGKTVPDITTRVAEVLDLVGVADKRNVFPQQLSAGELQRVSIARAIAGGPKILLADEPTGNLDPQTSWDILEILQEINRVGTTVVMATHNASIVDDLKKRTIMMDKGLIVSDEEKGHYKIHNKHNQRKHHEND